MCFFVCLFVWTESWVCLGFWRFQAQSTWAIFKLQDSEKEKAFSQGRRRISGILTFSVPTKWLQWENSICHGNSPYWGMKLSAFQWNFVLIWFKIAWWAFAIHWSQSFSVLLKHKSTGSLRCIRIRGWYWPEPSGDQIFTLWIAISLRAHSSPPFQMQHKLLWEGLHGAVYTTMPLSAGSRRICVCTGADDPIQFTSWLATLCFQWPIPGHCKISKRWFFF